MTATFPLTILYRDDHYIAVHKPAGLLVHRSPISQDEVFLLQTLRDQIGQRIYPVHRLDRATSGVIIFGLSPDSARSLAIEFENKTVEKIYLALARGWVDEHGTIDHTIADDEGDNIPKAAITHYRCLDRVEIDVQVDRYPTSRFSLVQVMPETGRRHQIRKHFKHISHHLIGDTTHGNGKQNRYFRERFGIYRLMLMAAKLSFIHPYTAQPIIIETKREVEWEKVMTAFDWQTNLSDVI